MQKLRLKNHILILSILMVITNIIFAQTIYYVDDSGGSDFTSIQDAIDSPTVVSH